MGGNTHLCSSMTTSVCILSCYTVQAREKEGEEGEHLPTYILPMVVGVCVRMFFSERLLCLELESALGRKEDHGGAANLICFAHPFLLFSWCLHCVLNTQLLQTKHTERLGGASV